jgi:predicted esterase YcpF (UPF0227 family)
MISDQETVSCWVPVPKLTMVVSSVGSLVVKTVLNYVSTIYLRTSTLFSYLSTYIRELFPIELVTMKPNINPVEAHPQMSNNGHPVDGVLVGAGSPWPLVFTRVPLYMLVHSRP